jgi:hypothetical protein
MVQVANFGNASLFTGYKLKQTNVATASIYIPARYTRYSNANIFIGITGKGKKSLTGNARIGMETRVFVGPSFTEKVEITDYFFYTFYQAENEVGNFEVKMEGIEPADWDIIKEGNHTWFVIGGSTVFKGRIEQIERGSFGDIRWIGSDMSVRALNVETARKTYTNVQTNEIVSELIAPIPGLYIGVNENFGRVTVRNEYGSVLNFINELARSINFDWWISQDGNDNDIFNFRDNRGTGVSVKTYYTAYPLANSVSAEYNKDKKSLANEVIVLGRGDGINQIRASTYNASATFDELDGDIDDTQTSISLDDASSFPSSGEIRISEERITYTGKSGNTLTGCVRGANGTIANYHRNTTFVEMYREVDDAEVGSSIADNGYQSNTITIRSLIPEKWNDINETIRNTTGWSQTAELAASRALKAQREVEESITIYPDEPDDLGIVFVGDTVTVVDPTVGLNKDMIVTEKRYTYDIYSAKEEIQLVCSTKQLNIMRQLKEEREKSDNINNFMQGATNIYQLNSEDNCDLLHPLYVKFYLPDETIAINKLKCNYKTANFRADSKSVSGAPSSISVTSAWFNGGLACWKGVFTTSPAISGFTVNYVNVLDGITFTTQNNTVRNLSGSTESVVDSISISTTSGFPRTAGTMVYGNCPDPVHTARYLGFPNYYYIGDGYLNTSATHNIVGSSSSWSNYTIPTSISAAGVDVIDGLSWSNTTVVTGGTGDWESVVDSITNVTGINAINSYTNFTWSYGGSTGERATSASYQIPDTPDGSPFDVHRVTITFGNELDVARTPVLHIQSSLDRITWVDQIVWTPSCNAFEDKNIQVDITGAAPGMYIRTAILSATDLDVNTTTKPDMCFILMTGTTFGESALELDYGIYENTAEFTPPGTVTIDVAKDESTPVWVNIGTFTSDQNNLDLKEAFETAGYDFEPGEWYIIRYTPVDPTDIFGGRMRIESNVFFQIFINSE